MFSQVAALQTKLKDKENELKNIHLEFSKSQKCCTQLKETTSNVQFSISNMSLHILIIFSNINVKEEFKQSEMLLKRIGRFRVLNPIGLKLRPVYTMVKLLLF